MKTRLKLLVAAALIVAPWSATLAQTERSGGGGNAQLIQQLQQLASERTSLQAENTRLKGELDKLRRSQDVLRSAQDGAAARSRAAAAEVSRATADKDRMQNDLNAQRTRMQELVERFRETATNLKSIETDRELLKQAKAGLETRLGACTEYNGKLLMLNQEVLARMDGQGVWTALASREPFTQLKRVQLDNLVDEYRDRAGELRAPAPPGPP